MNTDLISEIKAELGIVNDVTNVELLQMLIKARNDSHPDKHAQEEKSIQSAYEEKFKMYDDFAKKLTAHIKKEKIDSSVVIYKERELEFSYFQVIIDLDKLKGEYDTLFKSNEVLKNEVKEQKETIEVLQQNKYEKEDAKITESLNNIYEIKKEKTVSFISLGLFVLTQLKYVKGHLETVFSIGGHALNIIMLSLLFVSILSIIYKYTLKIRLETYMRELISPIFLSALEVKYDRSSDYTFRYNYHVFDTDICEYVDNNISKFDKLFFRPYISFIKDELFKYIVLNLNKKQLIKETIPHGVGHKFILNK